MYKIYHRGKKYYIAKMSSKLDCPERRRKFIGQKQTRF